MEMSSCAAPCDFMNVFIRLAIRVIHMLRYLYNQNSNLRVEVDRIFILARSILTTKGANEEISRSEPINVDVKHTNNSNDI